MDLMDGLESVRFPLFWCRLLLFFGSFKPETSKSHFRFFSLFGLCYVCYAFGFVVYGDDSAVQFNIHIVVDFILTVLYCIGSIAMVLKRILVIISHIKTEMPFIETELKYNLSLCNIISDFDWLPYLFTNVFAITLLFFSGKPLDDFKIVLYILGYMFCTAVEIAFTGYFLGFGHIAEEVFMRINDFSLSEKRPQKTDEKKLLNDLNTEFLAACKYYELFSQLFQANGFVWFYWGIAYILSAIISLICSGGYFTLIFTLWWLLPPMGLFSMMDLCFRISKEGKKAFARLEELQKDNKEAIEKLRDENVPKLFNMSYCRGVSILVLVSVYVGLVQGAFFI